MSHSPLIDEYLTTLQKLTLNKQTSILDFACGSGRNGLYLLEHQVPVTFADIKAEALEQVKDSSRALNTKQQKRGEYWQVDFEQEKSIPLQGKSFAGIMVFRYLHRPLFEQIKAAIASGGMIIYETFTEQQVQFGRPKNPDFLLKANELLELFEGWEILHSFEGVITTNNDNKTKQAIAQIVAIKP
ncbi:MAG: class I SAM-dependent methyltransferase [Colwellia sp.]|nr:class I SAM-dependent methyltransferase [Colwellia sp.]